MISTNTSCGHPWRSSCWERPLLPIFIRAWWWIQPTTSPCSPPSAYISARISKLSRPARSTSGWCTSQSTSTPRLRNFATQYPSGEMLSFIQVKCLSTDASRSVGGTLLAGCGNHRRDAQILTGGVDRRGRGAGSERACARCGRGDAGGRQEAGRASQRTLPCASKEGARERATAVLHLDSRQEIEAAGIDPDHVEVETREREYEPDYGNC